MAVLEKIRVKLGIFITILIALALLSFIIDPNTLSSTLQMFSSENKVGEMNGKSISYKDFYTALEKNSKLVEIIQQKSVSSEQEQEQLRNLTWQEFFDKDVFIPKAKNAGLGVGTEEMIDLTEGVNISSVLQQQRVFLDREGRFSREALTQFVQSISSDESGTSQMYWDFLEDAIYKEQLYSKYYSLIQNSNVLSTIEKQHMVSDNNIVTDVDFVMMPVGYAADSTIKISSSEVKDYYSKHKKAMKQLANRDLEYVVFEVVPSQEDIIDIRAGFDALNQEFAEADNLKNFISLNSDSKWSDYFYSYDELKSMPEFQELAFGKDKQTVSRTNESDNMFASARVVETKMLADSVKIYYTIVPTAQEDQADSMVNAINSGKTHEGMSELGWMTQAQAEANRLSEFNAAFDLAKGKSCKVRISSMQAIAVLFVEDKTAPMKKVKLAVFSKNINPSDGTYRDYQMKATELSDKANGDYNKFAAAVKEGNLHTQPAVHITEATRRIGSCDNAREVVRWAFDAKRGDVSDVITVDNKYYFVAALTKVRKDGYANIDDIKGDIANILMMEKKGEKLKTEVAEKINGCKTLEEIAEKLATTVSHQAGLSFGSSSNVSLDPKFIGAVSGASQGEICGPVAGDVGVYVFQVADKQSGTYFTEKDAETKQAQNTNYQLQALRMVMMEEASVKDNRARFF